MHRQHFLERAGRKAVAGHVDDVVGPGHHVEIAFGVHITGVAGRIAAVVVAQIGLTEAVVGLPECRKSARRQRKAANDGTRFSGRHFGAVLVQHPHVPPRKRLAGGARLHLEQALAQEVPGHRPSGLGLPPVVDDRHAENLAGPFQRVRVAALAGEEQRAQRSQVVPLRLFQRGVLALDGAYRRRRGEQRVDSVLADDAPEGAGVGRSDRLAFVKNGRCPRQQGRVNDVGMPHDPADVRRRPEHVARRDAVQRFHRPVQRNGVPAVVAHDPLRLPCGAGGVEDIKRIGRLHGHAVGGLRVTQEILPVHVAARLQFRPQLRPLQQNDEFRRMIGLGQRVVEQRLVGHDTIGFQAAAGGKNDFWPRLGNPRGQLAGGETSEDHRMDRAQPRAGQHCHHRLRDHGHVDQRPVASPEARRLHCAGQFRHMVAKFGVGEAANRPGHRTVVNQRRSVRRPGIRMPVQRVVTGVQLGAWKPPSDRRTAVTDLAPPSGPVNAFRRLGPELLRTGQPLLPNAVIRHTRLRSLRRNRRQFVAEAGARVRPIAPRSLHSPDSNAQMCVISKCWSTGSPPGMRVRWVP